MTARCATAPKTVPIAWEVVAGPVGALGPPGSEK